MIDEQGWIIRVIVCYDRIVMNLFGCILYVYYVYCIQPIPYGGSSTEYFKKDRTPSEQHIGPGLRGSVGLAKIIRFSLIMRESFYVMKDDIRI